MQENILDALARGEVIVADGAMGTRLHALGLPSGVMPELWNRERPDVVRGIHESYLDLDVELVASNTLNRVRMIGTNTFGGNRIRMRGAGLEADALALVRLGVQLAREAAGDRAWVAGSIGPTGQLMEPYGSLSEVLAAEVFGEQAEVMAKAGADLILVETQQDADEACSAVRAAKARTALPVFCSFAFNQRGRTMMGLRPGDAAQRAAEAGADAVGANCGEGLEAIKAALEAMRGVTTLPLIAQANAGIPRIGEGAKTEWDVSPEAFATHAREFVTMGAQIVGGCCGTTPEHMAAVVAALR